MSLLPNQGKKAWTAALLAGGQSRRMGRDKRFLPVPSALGPMPLWQRQMELLQSLRPAELFISANDSALTWTDARVVPDRFPDLGPFGGLLACLETMNTERLLVLAVDLPRMDRRVLQRLVNCSSAACGTVARLGSKLEPLAAALEFANKQLKRCDCSLQHLLTTLEELRLTRPLDVLDGDKFINWNYQEDYSGLD